MRAACSIKLDGDTARLSALRNRCRLRRLISSCRAQLAGSASVESRKCAASAW